MFWKKNDPADDVREKRRLLQAFHVSETVENHLMERMSEQIVEKGGTVVREGEVGNSMYFIASGALTVLKRDAEGNDVEIARMTPGDFFGEFSFLRGEPRTATVVAAEDSRLYEVERKRSINFLISSEPGLERELENALLRRRRSDEARE